MNYGGGKDLKEKRVSQKSGLKMIEKLKQLEQRLFTAPYRWLVKKGIVLVLDTSKRVYLTMEDLYEKKYLGDYKGNPNFVGDD